MTMKVGKAIKANCGIEPDRVASSTPRPMTAKTKTVAPNS
jgi:hypothetical protein